MELDDQVGWVLWNYETHLKYSTSDCDLVVLKKIHLDKLHASMVVTVARIQ